MLTQTTWDTPSDPWTCDIHSVEALAHTFCLFYVGPDVLFSETAATHICPVYKTKTNYHEQVLSYYCDSKRKTHKHPLKVCWIIQGSSGELLCRQETNMKDKAAILFEYQKIFIVSFKMQIKEIPVHHCRVTKAVQRQCLVFGRRF